MLNHLKPTLKLLRNRIFRCAAACPLGAQLVEKPVKLKLVLEIWSRGLAGSPFANIIRANAISQNDVLLV